MRFVIHEDLTIDEVEYGDEENSKHMACMLEPKFDVEAKQQFKHSMKRLKEFENEEMKGLVL